MSSEEARHNAFYPTAGGGFDESNPNHLGPADRRGYQRWG